MINYQLNEIAEIVNGQLIGDGNVAIHGVAFDSRAAVKGNLFAPIIGEKADGHSFVQDLLDKGIAASLWQRNDPLPYASGNLIVVDDVVAALQKLAAHYRRTLKCRFVGITGSSGKTSTKDIVASVLSAGFKVYKTKGNQNNDIGVPVTILNVDETVDFVVAEMGINDFGVMDRLVDMVQPDYTVITSIGPAHIAQLKTIDHIVEQKCLINRDLKDGFCFYNHQAYGLQRQLEAMGLKDKAVSYGFNDEADIRAEDYCLDDEGTRFRVEDTVYSLPVLGQHQVLNALASIGLAEKLGMSRQQIQQGLSSVRLTPHRLQIRKIGDAMIIDDTYNANPSSMIASLQTVAQYNHSFRKTVVLGDMLELGEDSYRMHGQLAEQIDFRQFDDIVLVGSQMKALHQSLDQQGIRSVMLDDNKSAQQYLAKYLEKGNVIFFKASNGMHFAALIDELEESL